MERRAGYSSELQAMLDCITPDLKINWEAWAEVAADQGRTAGVDNAFNNLNGKMSTDKYRRLTNRAFTVLIQPLSK